MRVVGPSSEDEMVAVFLRGELSSSRFGPHIRRALLEVEVQERVIADPRVDDEAENDARRRVLDHTRAYSRKEGLFGGFPGDVTWQRVALTAEDLAKVRYIDYDYWIELSGGSRLALDGARNARAGAAPFGVSSDGFVELAEELAAGARFPELILVTASPAEPVVVLEGHARLTAYLMRPDAVPDEFEALLGTSPAMAGWGCY
jgi:hypothetical protein